MPNTVYSNKVIEAKAKDLLSTAVNARSLMTVDTSLEGAAGMVKTINTYTYTGYAEEVTAGSGNTNRGTIAYVGKDYTTKMVQQAFDYTDEDFLKDNVIVDYGVKGATQVMSNKMTTDFYAALATTDSSTSAELVQKVEFDYGKTIDYDTIVDAISKLNVEDESGIFILIPNEWKADLRKDDDYKAAHMGDVVYNGQVGTICGIPVIATKALNHTSTVAAKAYVMTKEAVTLFMKKDIEVEQDRDADKRQNSIYLRDCYICALTDATKACKICEGAQSTD